MKRINRKEKGQTIVLVVISIIFMVIMAALVIDGGNAFMRRRQAQTAADAAALAAAYEKCVNNVADDALQPIVDEYATVQNDANSATYTIDAPTIDYPMGRVTVVATINSKTFFAKVLNRPVLNVVADASASCFFPATANHLLPIAWTCRERVGGTTGDCIIKTIPHATWEQIETDLGQDWFKERPLPATDPIHILDDGDGSTATSYYDDLDESGGEAKMLYVVMNNDSFDMDVYCEELNPTGTINCDFDDDGILDVEGGADRGWLSLSGTGGDNLSTLMEEGYPGVISLPQWFPGKTGVDAAVYDTAETIKFRINLIPVYNAVCESTTKIDLPTDCWTEYVTSPPDEIRDTTGAYTFFRIPGVAAFVITCVSKTGAPGQYCPGRDYAGVYDEPSLSNTKTLEGYFIDGYTAEGGASATGFDLGVYIISLVE